jgi:hypothetical protein
VALQKFKTTFSKRFPLGGIRSRRAFCVGLTILFCLIMSRQSEAQWFRNFGKAKQAPAAVFNSVPTQQQVVNLFRSRADQVTQLSANVAISIPGAPKIKGTLQVEFPSRMRMKAGFMGITEAGVDVGSNENQFWIWLRAPLPKQPPAFYHANHQEYAQSAMRKSIPLDPKWLVEGLGLIRIEPHEVYDTPKPLQGGWVRFHTLEQTASGQQWRQVLINARTGLIAQQAIYDDAKNIIAYSNSRDYKVHSINGRQISLPEKIELFMTQPGGEDMNLTISLSSVSLSPLYGAPEEMWGMPNPGKTEKINLARVSTANQNQMPARPANRLNQPQGRVIGFSRN